MFVEVQDKDYPYRVWVSKVKTFFNFNIDCNLLVNYYNKFNSNQFFILFFFI